VCCLSLVFFFFFLFFFFSNALFSVQPYWYLVFAHRYLLCSADVRTETEALCRTLIRLAEILECRFSFEHIDLPPPGDDSMLEELIAPTRASVQEEYLSRVDAPCSTESGRNCKAKLSSQDRIVDSWRDLSEFVYFSVNPHLLLREVLNDLKRLLFHQGDRMRTSSRSANRLSQQRRRLLFVADMFVRSTFVLPSQATHHVIDEYANARNGKQNHSLRPFNVSEHATDGLLVIREVHLSSLANIEKQNAKLAATLLSSTASYVNSRSRTGLVRKLSMASSFLVYRASSSRRKREIQKSHVRSETPEGSERIIGVWNLLDDSKSLRALIRLTLPRIRTCHKLAIPSTSRPEEHLARVAQFAVASDSMPEATTQQEAGRVRGPRSSSKHANMRSSPQHKTVVSETHEKPQKPEDAPAEREPNHGDGHKRKGRNKHSKSKPGKNEEPTGRTSLEVQATESSGIVKSTTKVKAVAAESTAVAASVSSTSVEIAATDPAVCAQPAKASDPSCAHDASAAADAGAAVDLGPSYQITARFLCSRTLPCWKESPPVVGSADSPRLHDDSQEALSADDVSAASEVIAPEKLTELRDLEALRTATELEFKKDDSRTLVVHFHGGGFVAMSSFSHQDYTRRWARLTGYPILSVDYRLAPAHPYPIPFLDCWDYYRYAVEHASEQYVLILVYGASRSHCICSSF